MANRTKVKVQRSGRRRYPHPERMTGRGRMRQFVAYLRKTIHLPNIVEETVHDRRRSPKYSGSVCFLLTVFMLVMRIKSFNQFERRLADPAMKKLFGGRLLPRCVDTIVGALKKTDLASLEELHQRILRQSVENKALRKSLHRGMRFFSFDGLETIRSRNRSCQGCQTATYDTGQGQVTDHFHRFVFLYSLGPQPEFILGLQPQASLAQRKNKDPKAHKAEGEMTAVKPLIKRLRSLCPKLFDVGVGDGLYPTGPMINFMKDGRPSYELIAVLKKETDEPMADAKKVFHAQPPSIVYYDHQRKEHVRMWDSEGFQGLDSSKHPLRVIKAEVYKGPKALNPKRIPWDGPEVSTWWLTTTISAERLDGPEVFDALRHRWNEENVFAQLTQHWNIKHAYLHHEVGTIAMMYAFMVAFNLFQLFLYRRMRNFQALGLTALAVVEEMKLDYAQIKDARDGLFENIFA